MNRQRLALCAIAVLALLPMNTRCRAQQPDNDILEKLRLILSEQKDSVKPIADQPTAFSLGKNEQKVVKPQPEDIIETRLYDLAGLFAIAPTYRARGWLEHFNAPLFDLSESDEPFPGMSTGGIGAMGGMGGGGMGGMGGMFNVSDSRLADEVTYAPRPTVKSLTNVINEVLLRDERGRAEVIPIGASLIVKASVPTQEKIERFLKQIEGKWNARTTMMVHIHLLWLNSNQSLDLIRALRNESSNGVQSIPYSKLLDWIASHPSDEKSPQKSAHAHLHAHNGQTVAWVSGSQKRTVYGWQENSVRGAKPIPDVQVLMNGISCEVTPMLAAARDKITVDFHGRWVEPENSADANVPAGSNPSDPLRPDDSATAGQSIQTTIRLPVGQATLVGGGTQWNSSHSDSQMLLMIAAEIVSP